MFWYEGFSVRPFLLILMCHEIQAQKYIVHSYHDCIILQDFFLKKALEIFVKIGKKHGEKLLPFCAPYTFMAAGDLVSNENKMQIFTCAFHQKMLWCEIKNKILFFITSITCLFVEKLQFYQTIINYILGNIKLSQLQHYSTKHCVKINFLHIFKKKTLLHISRSFSETLRNTKKLSLMATSRHQQ